MHKAATLVTLATVLVGLLAGCKKEDEQPPPQQPYGQPPAYGQPGYGQPPAPGQPAPQQTQPAPTPGAPASTLSQPGPAALPCQTDATCIFAKCNTAFGKCVFPCQNDNDCIAPNRCILGTGLCAPSLGGAGGAGG